MLNKLNTPGIIYESNLEQGNSKFPCFCCGICCSTYQVRLDSTEAQKIADYLGVSLQKFLDDYTDPRWPGTNTYLLQQKSGLCVFLEQGERSPVRLCRIHACKPTACRQWSASLYRKECRQGLSLYWRLKVDDSGKIVGLPEDIQCFETFLKTLN